MLKLMLIGLDGATFRIIDPLCSEGKLPNLERLITNGAHGILESTFPPITAPAWTSLATGKNPGKTRVFGTLLRTSDHSFEKRPMNSVDIKKARAYWDYLSAAGIKVGVVNYPWLYPPYELNGVMISGLGSDPEGKIFYPSDLGDLVRKECGRYRIIVPFNDPKYYNNTPLFIKEILELLEINSKTLNFLLKSDLEVLTFVFSASDLVQHYMWKYIDSSHPYYSQRESEKYLPAFVEIWQKIDNILGDILGALPQNANMIVVSDHGFGPHKSSFYTNSWLEEEGYLFRRRSSRNAQKLIDFVRLLLSKIPLLYNNLTLLPLAKRIKKVRDALPIDMERSAAFSLVTTSFVGEIYINKPLIFHQCQSQQIQLLKDEIVQKLQRTCNSLGLHLKVYSPGDLYSGQYVNLAPDILFEIDDFECGIHYGFHTKLFQRPPDNPAHMGNHKKEGIFIAYGPDIKQGAVTGGARIYDIAPTTLHLCGLPVPTDIDGRVLTEVFRPDSEPARRQVKHKAVNDGQERIRDRVRKLKTSGKL
ncbi:MAG: alkaline phosphatase family protein [Dehalococcoidia bacterium]|nr:alkaline phosphatase family protein [Dehalococcoidia bacterium]